MRKITVYLAFLLGCLMFQGVYSQENQKVTKIETLQKLKERITNQEKEFLKGEIENINKRLELNDLSFEEAQTLKKEAAQKRALNIENRIAIVDNKIELLKRNEGNLTEVDTLNYLSAIEIDWGSERENGDRLFGVQIKQNENRVQSRYDRRTYSDLVLAVGFNNAIIDGQSLEDSPYKLGGSRFFEMGWSWRTRVFKNSNAVRLHYGMSFQFNGLKPADNEYFVVNNGETELQEFDFDLNKSKFRMDNLVIPIHFEFGPSKLSKTEKTMRYSVRNQFRFGIGGYGGFNMNSKQKLKYKNDENRKVKDKLKGGYNTSNFVYGLSAYAGFGGVQLYAKYDLNPIFRNAAIEQRNISLGVRFDLD